MRKTILSLPVLIFLMTAGCGDATVVDPPPPDPEPLSCEEAVPLSARVCASDVSAAVRDCYTSTDAPCAPDDSGIAAAVSSLEETVRESCTDDDTGAFTVDALVGRLQNSCTSESASLSSRTFGGPHGQVWGR